MHWLGLLETFGLITGIACVYLASKNNVYNWPIAIVSSLTFFIIFLSSKLYGDAVLQVYFLGISAFGWWYWLHKTPNSNHSVSLMRASHKILTWVVALCGGVLMGYILHTTTDTDVAFVDGFCTATSLVAQYLLSRRIVYNWVMWLVVDAVYIPLYVYKGLYPTALLYAVYLYLSFQGYRIWKQEATT